MRASVLVAGCMLAGLAALGAVTRVSLDAAGQPWRMGSSLVDVSADGRYVLFSAVEEPPKPTDQPPVGLFVRDRAAGTTQRVAIRMDGTPGTVYSGRISADGRYVGFISQDSSLVPDDTNGLTDVFIRDMVDGTTRIISRDNAGLPLPIASTQVAISADGGTVVFEGRYPAPYDRRELDRVRYGSWRDFQTGIFAPLLEAYPELRTFNPRTQLVGMVGAAEAPEPIPADVVVVKMPAYEGRAWGRHDYGWGLKPAPAYFSLPVGMLKGGHAVVQVVRDPDPRNRKVETLYAKSGLIPPDKALFVTMVTVHDHTQLGYHHEWRHVLCPVGPAGTVVQGTAVNPITLRPTDAGLPEGFAEGTHLYVWSRATGTVEMLPDGGGLAEQWYRGLSLRPDGGTLCYVTRDQGPDKVMVRTLRTMASAQVLPAGMQLYGMSIAFNADGSLVAFVGYQEDPVKHTMAPGTLGVYALDTAKGIATRIPSPDPHAGANEQFAAAAISADGRHVFFLYSKDYGVTDPRRYRHDIYVHDRQDGTTRRLTGHDGVSASATDLRVSADARTIALTTETALVPEDTNGRPDVYALTW